MNGVPRAADRRAPRVARAIPVRGLWMLRVIPVPGFLALGLLFAPAARSQDACLVLDAATEAVPAQAQDFFGFGCIAARVEDAGFVVRWNLSAEEQDGRPVTLAVQAAAGQQVEIALRGASAEAYTILRALDGGTAAADWHLLPGEYLLEIASSGAEGEFILRLDVSANSVSYSAEPAGTSDRATFESGAFERLGSLHGGADYIRWTVPADTSARTWLIQAEGTPGHPLTLKLFDADGAELMHHSVAPWHRLEVRGVTLPEGVNTFALSPVGDDPRAGYHLRAVPLGEVAGGVKRGRPNSFDAANRIDLARGVVGALEEDAADYYHLGVAAAEAGWFELSLGNAEAMSLCIHGADRRQLICQGPEVLVRMPMLHLDAGEYWFVIAGDPGQGHAYWLNFTPLAEAEGP